MLPLWGIVYTCIYDQNRKNWSKFTWISWALHCLLMIYVGGSTYASFGSLLYAFDIIYPSMITNYWARRERICGGRCPDQCVVLKVCRIIFFNILLCINVIITEKYLINLVSFNANKRRLYAYSAFVLGIAFKKLLYEANYWAYIRNFVYKILCV